MSKFKKQKIGNIRSITSSIYERSTAYLYNVIHHSYSLVSLGNEIANKFNEIFEEKIHERKKVATGQLLEETNAVFIRDIRADRSTNMIEVLAPDYAEDIEKGHSSIPDKMTMTRWVQNKERYLSSKGLPSMIGEGETLSSVASQVIAGIKTRGKTLPSKYVFDKKINGKPRYINTKENLFEATENAVTDYARNRISEEKSKAKNRLNKEHMKNIKMKKEKTMLNREGRLSADLEKKYNDQKKKSERATAKDLNILKQLNQEYQKSTDGYRNVMGKLVDSIANNIKNESRTLSQKTIGKKYKIEETKPTFKDIEFLIKKHGLRLARKYARMSL